MAASFLASPVDVDIKLEAENARKKVDLKLEKEDLKLRRSAPCHVRCTMTATPSRGRLRYVCTMGSGSRMRVSRSLVFIGSIELYYDRRRHEFLSSSQELAAPAEMRAAQTFDFLFKNVEKQHESY
ncbi:uncharacterized protein C8Q71DRAFT_721394 [Rhodofomes roseus]|uniref:Uncharacterized protein n=1 Tax=Rhodofomes roseus TaxID=34475 RepID=A0ABQ8KR10_9APHY|nr:uncharacterized protein C8Q71DRAFT_721394 [Rhodofomes roseus]KAH9840965.1 hypothetical protein C8Q71DRAFT_721394 [Rhodofomes roseus]